MSEIYSIGVDAINVDMANGNNLEEEIILLKNKDTNLQAEIESVASGGPAGVYSTVSALTSADPDHSKIYIVSDNGHWYYYNSGWQDGGVYQAIEIPNESITPEKIANHSVLNLFNKNDANIEVNKKMVYYNNDIDIVNENAFSVSGWISVNPGQQIYVDTPIANNINAIGYYDGSKVGLSVQKVTTNWTALGSITIPANAFFIRIGFVNNQIDNTAVYTSATAPENFINFGEYYINGLDLSPEKKSEIINSIVQIPTEIVVKQDGTGDYTNLKDALAATNTTGKFLINIYSGTYNVLSDYSSSTIENAQYTAGNINSFCGPAVNGDITIKGIGNVILNGQLGPTDYTATIRGQISTLNLQGNITLENLTIKSEYLRYAIHDDFTGNVNKTINLINCKIIGGTKYNGNGKSHGYGMGTRSGKITNFENCYFEPRFYQHTNYSFSNPSITTIKNSIATESFTIDDMGSGKEDQVNLISCSSSTILYNWYNNNIGKSCVKIYCDTSIPLFYTTDNNFITGDVTYIENTTQSTINKGDIIKRTGQLDFNVLTNNSDNICFYGIALEDIEAGKFGRVIRKNYIYASDLGLTPTVGNKFKIDNGALVTTENNDYIAICDMTNYIKLI